jgi:dTDP-glucose 4,6-dehydratase
MLRRYNIDTIIHFAAQSHVDNSFGNSIQFTEDNVLGTHCLLECARDYGKIKLFLHISTDEVYGEVDRNHPGCEEEKSLLNPTSPYAATKAAAEFLVRSYYHSFKLPIIITRGNNVYGPNQYPEKLIPRFITNLLQNKKCPIHGDGLSRRNFIYVDDVCRAVDIIMRKGKINEIYNIGSNDEYNVLEILEHLINLLGMEDKSIEEVSEKVEDRLFNDSRYCVNSTKLESLGWEQETNFIIGLVKTIDYYQQKIKNV